MIKPPIPANESERLAALRSYEILDTPPEEYFDDLVMLAAHICGTPSASISLVDEARQWFKARVGVEARETNRAVAFCAHGILQPDLLIVPDATQDARFKDNPLVTGAPQIHFYAGAPLITAEGQALGMVCVTDRQPRVLTPEQQEALRRLARQAVAQLELRKRTRELEAKILERNEAEVALRTSEERFRHAFDDAPIGMSLVNPDGRWLKVNRAMSNMIGYTETELLATDFQHITHPDDLAKDLELVRQVLAGTIPSYRMEKRYIHKTGKVVFVWLSVSLVRDPGGVPLYFVSQIENITERKEAEEALHVSDERFRLVVDGVKDHALLMLDPDGVVVSWNAGAERIKGYRAEEIIGRHFSCFYLPEAIAAGNPEEGLNLATREGRHEEKSWRLRKDGSRFLASVVITAIRDPDGKLRGFAKITRDITESERHAAEREKIIAELQELLMQVKTLSGLIPICGWCKSVRSDKGYWQTVEQYVRTNTSVTFSHGICPSCSVKFKDEIDRAGGISAADSHGDFDPQL